MVWVNAASASEKGFAIGRLRLGVPTLAAETEGEVCPRFDGARLQAHRLTQSRLRLDVLTLAAKRDAQFIVKLRILRTQGHGTPQRLDGLGILSETSQRPSAAP